MRAPPRQNNLQRRGGLSIPGQRIMQGQSRFITPRTAILAVFAAFGSAVGALAGAMPMVTARAGVDDLAMGLAITVYSALYIAAMSSAGLVGRHASHRAVMLAVLPALAVTVVSLLCSGGAATFFMAYGVFGLLLGYLDLFMNAEGSAIENDLRRPIFTTFHAVASLAGAVLALFSSWLAVRWGPWASGVSSSLCCAAAWIAVARYLPSRGGLTRLSAPPAPLPHRLALTILGAMSGLIVAEEVATMMWSANLLNEQAPQLAAIAGMGVGFFGLCNALVRFAGDRLRARFGNLPLMTAGMLTAIAGLLLVGASTTFAMSVAAFALVGFGTSVLIPCAFSLAASLAPDNRTAALSHVAMVSGAPRIMAPWLFGWVASGYGLGVAFSLLASLLGLALGLLFLLQLARGGQILAAQLP